MKKLLPFLFLTLFSLQANSIDELSIVENSIPQTVKLVSQLLGEKIEFQDEFPSCRLNLHIRKSVEKSVALEMLTDLLSINGALIQEDETGGYSAKKTEPAVHDDTMPKSLEKRLGSHLWQSIQNNNDKIGSITLVNESAITLITLIEQVTGRTALISVHVQEGKFFYENESVTKSELIRNFDSLLTEQNIYMHVGRNDTLKFLPEKDYLSDLLKKQKDTQETSKRVLPRRRVIPAPPENE